MELRIPLAPGIARFDDTHCYLSVDPVVLADALDGAPAADLRIIMENVEMARAAGITVGLAFLAESDRLDYILQQVEIVEALQKSLREVLDLPTVYDARVGHVFCGERVLRVDERARIVAAVGDSLELIALRAIAQKIEALALGLDGRAWTPIQYRAFAREQLAAVKA
jgi:hypothetical protein